MKLRIVLYLLTQVCVLSALAVAQGPGVPNQVQVPGELLSGPLAPMQGRTAVLAYHQGFLITNPESPGSAAGSDLLSRAWNISDPRNPTAAVITGMGPNTAIAAHGYFEEGVFLRSFPGGDYRATDANNDGSYEVTVAYPNNIPFHYPQNPPQALGWLSRGLMFQPFQTQMWWSYQSTNFPGVLYKRTALLSLWDHIGLTGVIGHPFLIGNILYIASDQTNTGIAAYDITPSLNSPGTAPQLLGVLKAPVGGYWPEIWGGDGKLLVLFPARDAGHFFVADVTDPTDMKVVADRYLPNGGDPSYAQFQDDHAFMDRYKINMRNNFSVDLVLDAAGAGIDVSQFSLPIGNLVATGGYPHPPTLSQGLAIWAHQAAPDTLGPSVGYHIPRDGATGYPLGAPVTLLIHETLRSETIVNGTSFLVRPLDASGNPGAAIPGRLVFAFNDILTFTPDQDFAANTTYEVSLPTGGIQDAVGNGMIGYSFRFSTGSSLGSGNSAPVINLFSGSAHPAIPSQPLTINYAATDPENHSIEYRLDFGDGSANTGWTTNTSFAHTYAAVGHYDAVLSVRDQLGATSSRRLTITVMNSPTGPRPTNSSSIAFDPSTNHTWVVNPDNDSVSRITSSGSMLEIALGDGAHPKGVSIADDGSAWVTCSGTDVLAIIASNGTLTETISLGYGSAPDGIAFTPDGDFALVTLYGSGRLLRIASANRTITHSLTLGPTPRAIAITAPGDRALVTRFISPDTSGQVWDISLTSGLVLTRTIALAQDSTTVETSGSGQGLPNYLAGITIDPTSSRAWVVAKLDNIRRGLYQRGVDLNQENSVRAIVSEISLTTHAEVAAARRDIDNSDSPSSVTFSPLGDYAFVTLQGNNVVAVYDTLRDVSVEANLIPFVARFATGRAPQGGVFNQANQLLVQDFLSRAITRLDVAQFLGGTSGNAPASSTVTVGSEKLAPSVLNGKRIFYNASDTGGTSGRNRMSGEGYISCATCHFDGGHDGRVWDFSGRGEGLRNTTDLRGRRGTGHGFVHWSANFDEIQDFENDIRTSFGGDGFMSDSDFVSRFDPLGSPKAGTSSDLDDLAAYVTSLGARHLPRSAARNSNGSKNAAAGRGEDIFTQHNCSSCHSGEVRTDSALDQLRLHDVGTIGGGSGLRIGQPLIGIDTPTLLSLGSTAPYLHSGAASTLQEVFTYAAGTTIQAEAATRTGATYLLNPLYGQNFRGGQVIGFVNGTDSAQFSSVHGGAGGSAQLTVRYSARYAAQQIVLNVNGVDSNINLPATLNNPNWYANVFSTVTVNVNLMAGASNTLQIRPVLSGGQSQVFIDEIRVITGSDRLKASPHTVISSLPSSDQDDLIQYLLQLDGSDDLTVETVPTNVPTQSPTPVPNPPTNLTPNVTPSPTSTPIATIPTAIPTLAQTCPGNSAKLTPGACGCAVIDTDFDGNGTFDCLETSARPVVRKVSPRRFSVSMKKGFKHYHLVLTSSKGKQKSLMSGRSKPILLMRTGKWSVRYRVCDQKSAVVCSAWSESTAMK